MRKRLSKRVSLGAKVPNFLVFYFPLTWSNLQAILLGVRLLVKDELISKCDSGKVMNKILSPGKTLHSSWQFDLFIARTL